jgi:hypothetical protein
MLTHPPHLRIRSPSPTTTAFTVSTAPPRATLSTRSFFFLFLFLRLVLVAAFLLVLSAKCTTLNLAAEGTILDALDQAANAVLQWAGVGRVAGWAAERIDWWVLGLVGAASGYAVFRRGYTGERLTQFRSE